MTDDMISRQAALDIYDDYNVAVENGELEAYRKHRERLLELPPAQPGWIPCSESPMKNNSYLVWMPFAPEGHHITVAEWCGSYWNIKTPITAWMPLPKAWEGEQDEAEQ